MAWAVRFADVRCRVRCLHAEAQRPRHRGTCHPNPRSVGSLTLALYLVSFYFGSRPCYLVYCCLVPRGSTDATPRYLAHCCLARLACGGVTPRYLAHCCGGVLQVKKNSMSCDLGSGDGGVQVGDIDWARACTCPEQFEGRRVVLEHTPAVRLRTGASPHAVDGGPVAVLCAWSRVPRPFLRRGRGRTSLAKKPHRKAHRKTRPPTA